MRNDINENINNKDIEHDTKNPSVWKRWREENKDRFALWITMGVFLCLGMFTLYLISDLYKTTVMDYDVYARAASDDQWKLMSYSAQRGQIYDANGNPLASNTYDYTVVCSPKSVMDCSSIKDGEITRSQIINDVSVILGVDISKLEGILPVDTSDDSDPRNHVAGCDVCRNVPVEQKEQLELYIKEHDIDGFGFVAVPQRYYNYSNLASQVIGYATNNGEALTGIYGLEAYYNDVLSGTDGHRYSEVDSRTDGVLPYSAPTSESAVNGNNLVLNIDVNIQRIAEEACRNAYQTYSPRGGVTAIVMQPYTGAVLAMVSLPDYDLNEPYAMPYGMNDVDWMTLGEDGRINYLMSDVWRNRCISDTYEPGSTFKALTTAAALEEGLTNENEYFSDAPIEVSDVDTISCWLQKSHGYNHGTETLLEAFENSCNPIFVQLSRRIGLNKYYNYVHAFGFYETTGIDLPAEGIGIFHENPSVIDMSSLSFGESSTVTPIQLLNSYCAIINGGSLMEPHIVHYITDENGNIVDEVEPKVIRTIFSEDTCRRVRAMMSAVVNDGTGSAGQVAGYDVAGKTSTSTIENGEEAGMHVLSFSCFAPAANPEIAVLVVLNKPEDRSVGSSAPASTAAKIVEQTLTYMNVERIFTEEEYDEMVKKWWVQPVGGLSAAVASSRIGANGISTVYGSPDMNSESIISYTYPGTDTALYSTGVVVLYSDADQMLTSTVPNLRGKNAVECIEALRECNLNCDFSGDIMGVCVDQGMPYGSSVFAGTVINVTLENTVLAPTPTPAPIDPGVGEDGVQSTDALPPDEDGVVPEDGQVGG